MKEYTSSLDTMAKIMTGVIIAIALIILFSGITKYRAMGDSSVLFICVIVLPFLLLVGLIIGLYCYAPQQIAVTNDSIIIERKVKPKIIKFSEIKSVKQVSQGDMGFVIRTFGNGGAFGYTGKYYSNKMGAMTWYCTRRSDYVMLELQNGKKIIITPDDPSAFLKDVQNRKPLLAAL